VRLVWRPEDVEHMWNNHKITPDEAEEVFDDPYLLTYSPDYASKSGSQTATSENAPAVACWL
jgi:hypothetical protein